MSKLRANIDAAELEMHKNKDVSRGTVAALIKEVEAYMIESIDALERSEVYFEKCADADCDQDGYIPNEEMKLLQRAQSALRLV